MRALALTTVLLLTWLGTSLSSQATSNLYDVVSRISDGANQKNDSAIVYVLSDRVTMKEADAFLADAHEFFGQMRLVYDRDIPDGIKPLRTLGKKPSKPWFTSSGLVETEKRGLCVIELQREKGMDYYSFIVISGNPSTKTSAGTTSVENEGKQEAQPSDGANGRPSGARSSP